MLTSQGPPVNALSAFVDVKTEASDAEGLHKLFKSVQSLVLNEKDIQGIHAGNE